MSFKPFPVKNRYVGQPYVVVGCIIERDGKFLLVQEAVTERGKWNQPAGWLDFGEKIVAGAKREAEEETGLKLKIIGFLGVYSIVKQENHNTKHPAATKHAIKLIFVAKPLSSKIKFDPQELLAAEWFTLAEIKKMKRKLRDYDIIKEIGDYRAGKICPAAVANNFINKIKK